MVKKGNSDEYTEKKQMQNGDSIILNANKNIIYYLFDITDIEPLHNLHSLNDMIYQPDDIRLAQNDREYILTINGKPTRVDLAILKKEAMMLAIAATIPAMSADLSKLITEFSFGNIAHHIAYIIGTRRREVRRHRLSIRINRWASLDK